jgi:nucleotide-binding universal stress UspA family protein
MGHSFATHSGRCRHSDLTDFVRVPACFGNQVAYHALPGRSASHPDTLCSRGKKQNDIKGHRLEVEEMFSLDITNRLPPRLRGPVESDASTRWIVRESPTMNQGILTQSVVETGVIYDCILQAAIDHQADLLVLGTRAAAKIGRAALGTVARRLLATAPCPILTVPLAANSNIASAGGWNNVLVATDFSDASLDALNRAQAIVRSQLIVLHVSDDPASSSHRRHLELLRFLAPFNESHTVPVEHVVAAGEAGEVIAEHADRLHADLVVLGSPIDERGDEEFETSTVLQVISNVSCPMLCVPSARDASVADVVNEFALSD